MFDKLLALASIFDWISPLAAGVQDHVSGPGHTFLIPDACGWSGREIERLIRRSGIKTWGAMIVNHRIMLTVPTKQAWRAEQLLQKEGIPVESSPPRRH